MRGLQASQRREAVKARHHHVEQHDVRQLSDTGGRQQIFAVRINTRLIAAAVQERLQVVSKRRIVICDRNNWRLHENTCVWFLAGTCEGAKQAAAADVPPQQRQPRRPPVERG